MRVIKGGRPLLLFIFVFLLAFSYFIIQPKSVKQSDLFVDFSETFFNSEGFPGKISYRGNEFNVDYTINERLQTYVEKHLKRFKTPYVAVVVIDNNTGKIISATGYDYVKNKKMKQLAFSTTHPAASLFKIVSAASIMEDSNASRNSKFNYSGKGTTLYKYQLKNKRNKWSRNISLERAFSTSNNVVFGKAAINRISSKNLYDMAERFYFNKKVISELDVAPSIFNMARDEYNLAEFSSGFNKKTTLSPMHAAFLSYVIANEGKVNDLSILEKVSPVKSEKVKIIMNDVKKYERVISKETASNLMKMMELTVQKGTARKSFSKLNRRLKKSLKVGGKTGSITGGFPYGKHEWFTAFAMPKKNNDQDRGISISVLNILHQRWYIRSAQIAKDIIEFYYRRIHKNQG